MCGPHSELSCSLIVVCVGFSTTGKQQEAVQDIAGFPEKLVSLALSPPEQQAIDTWKLMIKPQF